MPTAYKLTSTPLSHVWPNDVSLLYKSVLPTSDFISTKSVMVNNSTIIILQASHIKHYANSTQLLTKQYVVDILEILDVVYYMGVDHSIVYQSCIKKCMDGK